jgi:Lar family restriction alleviation protein
MDELKLRPCPYCGKNMQKFDCAEIQDRELEHMVICSNCGAVGPNERSMKQAAEMWNLRRIEDALTASNAELLAACKLAYEWMDYHGFGTTIPQIYNQLRAAIARAEGKE